MLQVQMLSVVSLSIRLLCSEPTFRMNLSVLLGFVLGALPAAATVFHAKPGQKLVLECGVKSYSNSLKWIRGTDSIIQINGKTGFRHNGPAAIRSRSNIKHDKNLEISSVRKEDVGTFTCEADGVSHVHTLLVVSVSASPSEEVQLGGEVTLHCEVAGLDKDAVVQWKDPGGSLQPGPDAIHLKPVNALHAGTWQCGFSFDGQELTESLEIRVKDPALTSPAVPRSKVNGTPCPNCDSAPPSGGGVAQMGWWLWAVAGAGCVVVLLLVVLIIILCRRIRRRKKRFQRMQTERRSRRPTKYCQCNCPAAATKPQRARQKGRPSTLALKPLLIE